jgi:hypothetical protein
LQPEPDDKESVQTGEASLSALALTQIAQRISLGQYPIQTYHVPKNELLSLLDFLIVMLASFDACIAACQELLGALRQLKEGVNTSSASELSWRQIVEIMEGGMVRPHANTV